MAFNIPNIAGPVGGTLPSNREVITPQTFEDLIERDKDNALGSTIFWQNLRGSKDLTAGTQQPTSALNLESTDFVDVWTVSTRLPPYGSFTRNVSAGTGTRAALFHILCDSSLIARCFTFTDSFGVLVPTSTVAVPSVGSGYDATDGILRVVVLIPDAVGLVDGEDTIHFQLGLRRTTAGVTKVFGGMGRWIEVTSITPA